MPARASAVVPSAFVRGSVRGLVVIAVIACAGGCAEKKPPMSPDNSDATPSQATPSAGVDGGIETEAVPPLGVLAPSPAPMPPTPASGS